MSQININGPDDSGDRTAAAGINLISVIIILLVLIALVWFLFAGPVHLFGGTTNINVNPPAQQAPANPAPGNPAPGGTSPGYSAPGGAAPGANPAPGQQPGTGG